MLIDLKAAKQAAKQRERQQALAQALREMAQPVGPVLTDFAAEREARDQSYEDGRRTRAGWNTYHLPEERRYVTYGTVDGAEVTGPYVTHFDTGPGLGDACDAAINAARKQTGEGYTDVVIAPGNSKWIGPMG